MAATSTSVATQTLADQNVAAALETRAISAALEYVELHRESTTAFLANIAAIVSPSGKERKRAEAVAARMRNIGLASVFVDETPNAIGVIPGYSGLALVFISTLDDLATVADYQRTAKTSPHVKGDHLIGPGTNTSSSTASILAAAEALVASGFTPEHDLVFAAVAQEETGLIGMKVVYEAFKDRAVGFVDVLGDGRRISYGAIGIHWWRVIATGPPGHSLRGGLPNVNQAIGRAVDRILQMPLPPGNKDSRTIVNVAMLRSGAVFNHKPATGWFSLDIRSLDMKAIDAIEADVATVLSDVSSETGIQLEMEPFQLTPSGQIPGARESTLVTTAEAISRHLGLEPTLSNSGSSNMNIAIGNGTLAIGLGGSRGGKRAEAGEWANIPAMLRTATHVVLLAATIGGGT
ncbi:MAG: M20/M25/M40 family metallo-hydrolase [Acidobacteriota bacterium]|nr:M20/M25/M40 family metallo-hydrolase [Acidobacteriota bacterium]